jgi:hypothetical protein
MPDTLEDAPSDVYSVSKQVVMAVEASPRLFSKTGNEFIPFSPRDATGTLGWLEHPANA